MIALRVKQQALLDHVQIALDELANAQAAKDRAEEELVAARACCSTVGEGDGEVDPKIAEMEGYLQEAKNRLAEAELAAQEAQDQYQKAVDIKDEYDAEKVKIEQTLQVAKTAMDNAEEEYKEAQKYTDGVVQQGALTRAQNAYNAAKGAYDDIMADQQELDEMCTEADSKIAEAKAAYEQAWAHKDSIDSYVGKIQDLYDEYTGGDGDNSDDDDNSDGDNSGDGDCHEEHKKKADQHLQSSETGLTELQGYETEIDGHVTVLKSH